METIPRRRSNVTARSASCVVQREGYGPKTYTGSFTEGFVMNDVLLRGYHKTLRSGLILPVNPASREGSHIRIQDSSWGYDKFYPANSVSPIYKHAITFSGLSALARMPKEVSPSASTVNFSEHDVRVAYTNALASCKTKGMDVATFAAEFNKTVGMVTGLAGRILERARTLNNLLTRRGAYRKGNAMEVFSSSWLEYRYGWRLLGNDIEDIIDLINRINLGLGIRLRSKEKLFADQMVSSSTVESQNMTFHNPGLGASGLQYSNRFTYSESHRAQLSVTVMIESMMRANVTIDPLVTGYEVIPYSMILSWFTNCQEWITAVSPFLDERVVAASKRIDVVREITYSVGPVSAPFLSTSNLSKATKYMPRGGPSTITFSFSSWVRLPMTNDEKSFAVGYVNNFDSLKALDIISILFGRVNKLRNVVRL